MFLILQFTANVLGSMIHSNRPLVFAGVIFIFANPLKIHFSHTFWVATIARTNYNCKIGHRAQDNCNVYNQTL